MKPGSRRPIFPAPPDILRDAGGWVARIDRGLSDDEKAQFIEWLRADPRHPAAFGELERTFESFDRLRELAPAGGTPDPDVFAPARRPSRRWWPALATAGLAAAAACAVLFWSPRAAPLPSRHYFTETNGYQRVVLSDGSIVQLNSDTALDVEFTRRERRARLNRGEAHFQVEKDPTRPFIVLAHSVALRVVGTAFDVRMESAGVAVFVTEGSVEVHRRPASAVAAEPSADVRRVTAGQKILVPVETQLATPAVVAITTAEAERIQAWQSRLVEFRRTPLAEAVAEFNRHSGGRSPQIVIRDPELATLRIGGNFRLDQPDAFVWLLEESFGVAAERTADTITLRRAP